MLNIKLNTLKLNIIGDLPITLLNIVFPYNIPAKTLIILDINKGTKTKQQVSISEVKIIFLLDIPMKR